MKKIMVIALSAVLLASAVVSAQIGTVTYKVLLVRAGPSKKHKVVARVKRGQRPLIEDLRGAWVKLAWRREAWVAMRGLSLEKGIAQSSAQDEQFVGWLINDTQVNWAFVHRKAKGSISLWARMDSDRYGGVERVKFIAQNLVQSYRFHTGETGPVKIKILKPNAKFNHEIYFQATFE